VLPRPVWLLAVLLPLLLATAPLAAQSGTLQGTVTDSAGATLSNAAVTVEGTGLRATSGASGGYEIRGVPAGSFTVRARLIGFQASTARVTVEPGATARQDFTLARSWRSRWTSTRPNA
jgi:iron complex outermembrane receptor protein